MNHLRAEKVQRNIIAAFTQNVLNYILLIVSRVLFVRVLQAGYLGINGLFSNILNILSMADLGMGTVLMYSLYKPVADSDTKKIGALIDFFRKIYLAIAIVVFIIGMVIVPFLDDIIRLEKPIAYLELYYILALLNVVISYLFIYRTTLLVADQKGYILNKYTMVCKIITFVAQSLVLVLCKNYLLYLAVALVAGFIGNILQNRVTLKTYPYLKKNQEKLEKKEKRKIIENVKATFMYKVCSIVQGNTDSILISVFAGTIFVGYYSNYFMIITAMVSFLTLIFSAVKAGLGNLIASADRTHKEDMFYFNILELANFWMVTFCSAGFLCLSQDFVQVFFGTEYMLEFSIIVALTLNFYTGNIRQTLWAFRETTGLFQETKYITAVTAVLNLFLSVIFGYYGGITGIIAATVIARMLYAWWKEPKVLFLKFFQKSPKRYYVTYIKRLCQCAAICALTFGICSLLPSKNIILFMIGKILVCCTVPNILLMGCYLRTSEFQYICQKIVLCTIKRYLGKIKNHIKMQKKYFQVVCSKEFKVFRRDYKNRKIILIDTPEHGNLGDQAIALAEYCFLQEECGITKVYEFSKNEYCAIQKKINKYIKDEDLVCIHGGGFIGTLWQDEEDVFLQILQQFCNNRIIVFPQTVYFQDHDFGRSEKEKFRMAAEMCKDLIIFTRDWNSYRFLIQELNMDSEKCFCVPDIVTYLKLKKIPVRKRKILLCLRKDKEKKIDDKALNFSLEWLKEKNYEITYTDTVVKREISKTYRAKLVAQKLNEFSMAKLVITDRLHGMLFAAITGTPCIAMDNISKKVSGVFAWIQYLDYIRYVEPVEIDRDMIEKMLLMEGKEYSNDELRNHYNIIKEAITK